MGRCIQVCIHGVGVVPHFFFGGRANIYVDKYFILHRVFLMFVCVVWSSFDWVVKLVEVLALVATPIIASVWTVEGILE